MVPPPAGIRIDVSLSSPGRRPSEELRADSRLVSLETWTQGPTDSVPVPALSG